MEDVNFLKNSKQEGAEDDFEIVTMTDELKKTKSEPPRFSQKKSDIIPDKKREDFVIVEQGLTHQDRHPILITTLLLVILGSVVTMAFAWWYMIYYPMQFISQMALVQQSSNQNQVSQVSLNNSINQNQPNPDLNEPQFNQSKYQQPNIFFMEEILNFDINQGSLTSLINQELNRINEKDVFVRIKINKDGAPLSINQIFENFNVSIDKNVLDNIDQQKYNIFAYIDNNKTIRIGGIAVLKSQNNNLSIFKQVLESNEKEIIQKIKTFVNFSEDDQDIQNASFNNGNYKDTPIRYYNFKKENFAIDYAILEKLGLFLFSTSKDSMFNAIDRILKNNQITESYPQPDQLTSENKNDIIENNQEVSQ